MDKTPPDYLPLLSRLYQLLLRLYPASFRDEYSQEMRVVFNQNLAEASRKGRSTLVLWLRELKDLPIVLTRMKWRQIRAEVPRMNILKNLFDYPNRSGTWGEGMLAALPHLLVVLMLVLSSLFPGGNPPAPISVLIAIVLLVIVSLALYKAWRENWPRWSASWMFFMFIAILAPISGLLSLIPDWRVMTFFLVVVVPLFVLLLLVRTSYSDPVKTILMVLPVTVVLWSPLLESVPDSIRGPISMSAWLLNALAAVAIVRLGSLSVAIGITLGVVLIDGLPASFAGIYHGGALPFFAPGPSPLVALVVYIPFLMIISLVVVGPLLFARLTRKHLSIGS